MNHQSEEKNIKHIIKTELDDFGRKKFTLHQEQDVSQQQTEKLIDMKSRHNSNLVGRDEGLNIEKYIGKIQNAKKIKKREVFYCDVCEEGFKCDIAYITHCNSPAHNRKLGMNMKVKAVSTSSVAKKIQELNDLKKNKKDVKMEKIINKFGQDKKHKQQEQQEQQEQQQHQDNSDASETPEKSDQQSQVKKQAVKSQEKEENQDVNPSTLVYNQQSPDPDEQMMKMMGLPTSFGSKKKKRN